METKKYRVQPSSEQINADWFEIHNQMNDGMDEFVNKLEVFSNKLTVSLFYDLLEKNQLNLSSYENYCISMLDFCILRSIIIHAAGCCALFV